MSEQELAEVTAILRDLHDHHKQILDLNHDRTQLRFEINKQVISFFERLLLLDLGVVALSVNALIALFPKLSEFHAHRMFFAGSLTASWVFLLAAGYFCSVTMAWSIGNNRKLAKQSQKQLEQFTANIALFDIGRLSRVANSAKTVGIVMPDKRTSLSELLEKTKEAANSINAQDFSKILVDPFSKRSRFLRPPSLALNCMYVGLVLLCFVAIRMLLAL